MNIIIGLAIFAALLAIWVLWGRPWMRDKPWAQGFFAWIEPYEITLWRKSETILKARAMMLTGILLTVLTQAGSLDITPLMPLVPDAWEPFLIVAWNMIPLTLTAIGAIDEKLRKDTTKPIELVEIPESAPIEVKIAAAQADSAKVEAVAVVKAEEVKVAAVEAAATPPTKGSE